MKKQLTLITFALVAFSVNAQSTLKGDVNGDGEVNVTDVTMIVEHVMGQHNSNNDHLSLVGLNGLYWSSTSSFSAYLARSLGFDSSSFGINYNNFRNNGFSVRPVCK